MTAMHPCKPWKNVSSPSLRGVHGTNPKRWTIYLINTLQTQKRLWRTWKTPRSCSWSWMQTVHLNGPVPSVSSLLENAPILSLQNNYWDIVNRCVGRMLWCSCTKCYTFDFGIINSHFLRCLVFHLRLPSIQSVLLCIYNKVLVCIWLILLPVSCRV